MPKFFTKIVFVVSFLLSAFSSQYLLAQSNDFSPKYLANITLTTGTLVQAFNPLANTYTINVSSDVNNVGIKFTTDPYGYLFLNWKTPIGFSTANPSIRGYANQGTYYDYAVTDTPYTFAVSVWYVGRRVYTGHSPAYFDDAMNYFFTIHRIASKTLLTNIAVNGGELSTNFDPLQPNYDIATTDSSITIKPTIKDSTSIVTVNGQALTANGLSAPIQLSYNTNANIAVKVTATDSTSFTYNLNATRIVPPNLALSALTLSNGTLSPQFNSNAIQYTAAVNSTVSSLNLTPALKDTSATVTVNGVNVLSGQQSADIPLQLGNTPVKLVITSTQGSSQTYNLTVTHTGNAALLSSLTSSIATDTNFSPQIFDYTATVFDDVHNVILTPTAAFADAKIQINGSQVTGGQATTLPLANGKNTFSITVTGAGDSVKTYTLTINRLLPQTITFGSLIKIYGDADFAPATASTGLPITYESSDENVAAIADGQIHITGAGTVTITASQAGNDVYQPISVTQTLVVKQVQNITFTAQTKMMGDADFDAAVSSTGLPLTYKSSNTKVATIVNGKVHLIGAGTVIITASQGGNDANTAAPTVTSTITVTANPLSQAQLLNLETNISSIIFAPATYSYSATVIDELENITLKPTAAFAYATIKINGNAAANGAVSTLPLAIGSNVITITVKGTDATVKTYTITINRVAGTTELTGIILDKGTLSPQFDPLVHNYDVTLDARNASIQIKPVVADETLKVTVGNMLYDGNNAVNVPLLSGNNAIPVTVSKGGEMDRTYYVNVNIPTDLYHYQQGVYSSSYYDNQPNLQNSYYYITVPSSTTSLPYIGDLAYGLTKNYKHFIEKHRNKPDYIVDEYFFITRLMPQTITLGELNKLPTDKDFAPATSTTHNPITYISSNPSVAVISGGKIHITGTGTTAITATQFGNAQYEAASKTQTLTVGKKAQSITFAAQTKTLADIDFIAATTSSKLPLLITSSNLKVATILNGKIHLISAGTTTITVSQAGNDTYNAVTLSQMLTVTQSAQIISFAPEAKTMADTDFVAATISSQLPVSFTSSNTKVATIVNGKVHIVGVGTTTITASQAGNSTYTPVTQSQEFTVTQATQTIAFVTQTKTYGDADFLPATATSGLPITYSSANWDVASIVDGKIHIEKAGKVIIWADQPGSKAYSVAESVSSTMIINKAPQIITFAAINKNLGDEDFAPATVNSKLQLTYTISNTKVATVVNGKLHIVGVGTATITASQKGNENYIAASVSQVLTITKGLQTITFPALTKNIGDADFSPATISSALVITYTSSNSKVATIVKGKVHIVGAGTVTITASQTGDGNYTAAKSISQTLTVTKASQTITFAATATKTYGDADFIAAAFASSKLPVIYISSDSKIATIINGKIHLIASGTVIITASQAGNDIYAAAKSLTEKLTIAKGTLTITAENKSKKAGAANPALTATYKGFVNGDDKIALTTQPKLITTATTSSKAGSYAITASGAAAKNYTIAYVGGKLTVTASAVKTNNFDIDEVPQPVVSEALSPNGDGLNDVLTIANIKSYPDNTLTVMDVNGNSVYDAKGYDNQERVFDGHSSKTHALQKQGTYYYILQYKDGEESKRLTGYIIMKY